MIKEVKLESILDQFIGIKTTTDRKKELVLGAMREACKQTLELAAENAKITIQYIGDDGIDVTNVLKGIFDKNYLIDRQSILDTINQIK